jgi:hypothetical protein
MPPPEQQIPITGFCELSLDAPAALMNPALAIYSFSDSR